MAAAVLVAAAVLALLSAVGPVPAADLDAAIGKALFERAWVPAPATTDSADGLGPLFSARACASCHPGAGPAAFRVAPDGAVDARGVVVRFGDAAGRPDSYYGHQLQGLSVPGVIAEGRVVLFAGGPGQAAGERMTMTLALNGPPLQHGVGAGVRAAPSLRGRADLKRIDERSVLALADPEDANEDGISGRARLVGPRARPNLGRFGWKGAVAELEVQVASAFAMDMGLSSARAPRPHGDCTDLQTACLDAPTGVRAGGSGHELSDEIIRLTATFVASRRAASSPDNPQDLRLFTATGCASCHVPDMPGRSGEPIRAFTDLLLHDMGSGLDDGVGEPGVTSAEWRTAPLIDLDPRGGRRRYLHDGRAGTVAAAVAAHGGEAEASRARFGALAAEQRARLLRFLEGL